jgi:hypothetical protein
MRRALFNALPTGFAFWTCAAGASAHAPGSAMRTAPTNDYAEQIRNKSGKPRIIFRSFS